MGFLNPFETGTTLAVAGTLAASLLAIGCQQGEPAIGRDQANLIFGDVDEGHPAAVALSRFGRPFCTGTLISPSVVLTAAHCVDMLAGDPDVTIFFGTDIREEGVRIGVRETIAHPGWTGNLSGGNDIGMLLMDFPVDPELAIPLSLFDMTQEIGTEVERVGFGIYDAATMAIDGQKRTGFTTVTQVPAGADTFIAGDPDLITCSGDSGGPAFIEKEGVVYVAGVHSFGLEGCTSPRNGDTRVELFAEDFVLPWIQEKDAACGADLQCARIGCVDDPDCEPCGPDGTCTEDCALPDVDCQDRNLGDLCRADQHCTTGKCVVWRPEPKTSFCTEECVLGSDTCAPGMSCQTIQPFGDICYYDEEPSGVLGGDCEENYDCGSSLCEDGVCVYACDLSNGQNCPEDFACSDNGGGFVCHALPKESGGCSTSGSRDTGLWFGAVFLALFGAGRKRRRLCRVAPNFIG